MIMMQQGFYLCYNPVSNKTMAIAAKQFIILFAEVFTAARTTIDRHCPLL
jgi:hypothetical protein